MDGLLLKLVDPGVHWPAFWRLFASIRQDLDRFYWCFASQPWMAAPEKFEEDERATEDFAGQERTSTMLWRPGSLRRYADWFSEEYIDLWAIEPTVDDPRGVASEYASAAGREMDAVARRYAQVWLLYTDSTCWELYARKPQLLTESRDYLRGKPWAEVFESHLDDREKVFRRAGLSQVWDAIHFGRV